MPKVKPLGKTVSKETLRRENFNRLASVNMALEGIASKDELASRMDMPSTCLYKRWTGLVAWKLPELQKLFYVLKYTPEQIVQAMDYVVR